MPLAWAEAERTHQQALSTFVCTDPPKRQYDPYRGKFHPCNWELEVQSWIRGIRLPRPSDEKLLVGYDEEDGLTAVVHFGYDGDTGTCFRLWAMAVARRAQGQGYGRELLDQAFDVMRRTREKDEADIASVLTYVHPNNSASLGLLTGYGFEVAGTYDGYRGLVCEV